MGFLCRYGELGDIKEPVWDDFSFASLGIKILMPMVVGVTLDIGIVV